LQFCRNFYSHEQSVTHLKHFSYSFVLQAIMLLQKSLSQIGRFAA